MLNFVFGRGASPPWTPYRGVAPGPQWGPRRPPHPRPNGPSKFWRGAFGPSPKFSRVIPGLVTCQSSTSSTVNVKMARLTNDQKEACNAILEGHNLILTGQAGTGKTFVLPYPTITHHISALIHLLHPTSSIEVNKNNAKVIDQLRPTRPSQVKHPRSDELGQGKHPYRIMLKML